MKARGSSAQARAELRARLEGRREEIEAAVSTRVSAIADPASVADPSYADGLRGAVAAAIDHGLTTLERGERDAPSPPPLLLVQARVAARSDVGLDTVLRRYFAGYALLEDRLIGEVERGGLLDAAGLHRLLRSQAAVFERLVAAVGEEYVLEQRSRTASSEQRRAERIDRLLAGEPLDTAEFRYDFEHHHVGAIVRGPAAADASRRIATTLDRSLLSVSRDGNVTWAWFGGSRPFDAAELRPRIERLVPDRVSLVLGEPARGLEGWRLTHSQARAALPIALRGASSIVRYRDVALLASIFQDRVLAASLREIYLRPLECERGGGVTLREALRAYFAAGRSVSSAAAALGINRNTVAARLRLAEERIGQSLDSCATEVEAALRLEELRGTPPAPSLRARC